MKKLSSVALPLVAATAVIPVAAAVPAQAAGSERTISAYTTGYTWFDNTPAGSAQISHPIVHSVAGGTGTYSDPVTVAVGTKSFAAGTRFYIPSLQRYFVAEDTGGSQLNSAPNGADAWLDLWIGGKGGTSSGANACASSLTGVHNVIVNPASGYKVSAGAIYSSNGCDTGYSDSVKAGSSESSAPVQAVAVAAVSSTKATPAATKTATAKATESAKPAETKATSAETKATAKATPTVAATPAKPAAKASAPAVKAVKATPAKPAKAAEKVITVKPGDTLSSIARENGISDWQTIYNLNKAQIDDPDLIYVGQHFQLS